MQPWALPGTRLTVYPAAYPGLSQLAAVVRPCKETPTKLSAASASERRMLGRVWRIWALESDCHFAVRAVRVGR